MIDMQTFIDISEAVHDEAKTLTERHAKRLQDLPSTHAPVPQLCQIVAEQSQAITQLMTPTASIMSQLARVVNSIEENAALVKDDCKSRREITALVKDDLKSRREETEILCKSIKTLHDRLSLVEEAMEDLGFIGEDDSMEQR